MLLRPDVIVLELRDGRTANEMTSSDRGHHHGSSKSAKGAKPLKVQPTTGTIEVRSSGDLSDEGSSLNNNEA